MFRTSLANVKIKFGRKTLLKEALWIFRKLFETQKAVRIKDNYGTIAFDIGKAYLVAKKSTYGDIVSCHKKIWDMALKRKGFILMYIQEPGYFYRFNPAEIKDSIINERGGIEMVNFSIREGINLLALKAQKKRKQWICKKMWSII